MENYLAYKIIKMSECSSVDWKKDSRRNHTVWIQGELKISDYKEDNSRKDSIHAEAEMYKRLGYIEECKWAEEKNNLYWIKYSDTQKEKFYEIIGRIPKYQRIAEYTEEMSQRLARTSKVWIQAYYKKIIEKLQKGEIPEEFEMKLKDDKMHRPFPSEEEMQYAFMPHHKYDLVFQCLDALDELEDPMYKRVFSKKYFKDSKIFEKKKIIGKATLQDIIVSLVKQYGVSDPDIALDENMSAQDLLPQILIEEYGATLNIKGSLNIILDGKEIDLGNMVYGSELNSDTLKYAEISGNQNIKKIITIENKANYMSMPYEDGTLLIFSHGYPSPLERKFLSKLYQILKGQQVAYYHTGDLDYGGVCIFRYIRTRIFPELKPYQMDVETYHKYMEEWGNALGENETDTKRKCEKLRKIEEPLLQELIDEIVACGVGIEQESFLIKMEETY